VLVEVVRGEGNMVLFMFDVVWVEVIFGEICGVFKELWGDYCEFVRF